MENLKKIARWVAVSLAILAVCCTAAYKFGRGANAPHEPTFTYEPLPTVAVSRSGTELAPVSEMPRDSIVFVTVYRDRPVAPKGVPPDISLPPLIDTVASYRATVEDWNTERTYRDTLLHSDTLGTATLCATVQFNRLTGLDFRYTPRQKSVVIVVPPKATIQPYALTNITTRWANVGAGLKYGKVGIHAVAGYDYQTGTPSLGAGLLVMF